MAVEKVPYGGWQNCYKVNNGVVELVATAYVGPRFIRFGFVGGENEFAEIPEQLGSTGGDVRRNYGGHRLWHAPEVKERTYYPDNEPVEVEVLSDFALRLTPPLERTTGIQKAILVEMSPNEAYVKVTHFLTNRSLWAIEFTPWALTMMAKGRRAIVPNAAIHPASRKVLPACPLVLWHYTDMSDPRWHWGKKYIVLCQDPNATLPQKIGIGNLHGWVAYVNGDRVFIKRYKHIEGATYPDFGSSTELFTNAITVEVETLGPLTRLEPGETVTHVEHWFLFKGIKGR
ncbi:hypothetical protein [Fervidibacter sp.]|jgi:hypothetical protein